MEIEALNKLFSLADRQTKEGKFEQAINTYKKILESAGDDKEVQHLAHWGIGDIYLNARETTGAEYHLKEALKLDPENPDYHYLLGCSYNYKNEIEQAIDHIEKAIALDNTKSVYWSQLGWIYGYNRDLAKGIKYLKKSIELNPDNVDAYCDLCVLYLMDLQMITANVVIEEATRRNLHNERIDEVRAMAVFCQKEFDKLKSEGKA